MKAKLLRFLLFLLTDADLELLRLGFLVRFPVERCDASDRYLFTSMSLGSTAIRLAVMVPSGLVIR